MLSRIRFILPLVLLAACGTRQQQCIHYNTSDLRRIDRMIAETESNLARGYSYEDVTIVTHSWGACLGGGRSVDGQSVGTSMCLEPDEVTVRRAVPIDPSAEARKLEGLQARRIELSPAANRAIATCKATYPES